MMHHFNQTMKYLETTLDSDIDPKKIQQLSGYPYAMFSRLFSILADMTLAEYLRNRRLSQAVHDLTQTSAKIIDIALTYGYGRKSSSCLAIPMPCSVGFSPFWRI